MKLNYEQNCPEKRNDVPWMRKRESAINSNIQIAVIN